jgi:hypothetical protein
MEATNGTAMMCGIHGVEKIGSGFVAGFVLSVPPMHEQAAAETAKHAPDPQGFWFRTKHWSSRCETSCRWCSLFSMPSQSEARRRSVSDSKQR